MAKRCKNLYCNGSFLDRLAAAPLCSRLRTPAAASRDHVTFYYQLPTCFFFSSSTNNRVTAAKESLKNYDKTEPTTESNRSEHQEKVTNEISGGAIRARCGWSGRLVGSERGAHAGGKEAAFNSV